MPKRKKTALVRSRNVRLALERKEAARNAGQLDPPTNCSPAVSASTSNIQPVTRLLHIKTYKWLVNHMHTKNTSVVFQNIVSLHLEREIGSQTLSAVFSKLWIITHKSYLLRYFRSDFDETLEETQWMGVEDFVRSDFLFMISFFFNEYFKSRLVKTQKKLFLIN